MTSPSIRKIRSYIPHKLSINSQYQHLTFIKQKPKGFPRLILNDYDPMKRRFSPDPERNIEFSLTMAKQLKFVRSLRIENFNFLGLDENPSKMLYFIKKISKIQILMIRNAEKERRTCSPFSHLWPKHIKNLKILSLDNPYTFETEELLKEEIMQSDYDRPKSVRIHHLNKIKSIRFISKYQKRLRDLEIKFALSWQVEGSQFRNLDPQFYCPSLRKLTLTGGLFSFPVPDTSFDHFKNLRELELYFNPASSPEFSFSILQLLHKLPNLEGLSFICPSLTFFDLQSDLRSMKILTMLKYVRIYSCHLSLSHSKTLLKILENFRLKELSLDVKMQKAKEVNLILNLLEKLTQLETLNLDVYHYNNNTLEPSTIESLFGKVNNLQYLRHLDLKIKTFSKKEAVATIELPFSKLFTKSIPLETFNISCDQVQISHMTFFDLLESLKKRASSIKDLNLEIGEVILDEKEFQKFLEILTNFSEIRVLKLPMIGIHKRTSFMELADAVWTMQSLTSFGIGKFDAPIIGTSFIQGVEKILCKNGLVEFTCDASKDFEKKIRGSEFVIDWKKVKKLNPTLTYMIKLQNLFPEPK